MNYSNILAKNFSLFLNRLRFALNKLSLSRIFHTLRQCIHFGPWRKLPIQFIRICRPPQYNQTHDTPTLLTNIDTDQIVNDIRMHSLAIVGTLPTDFVRNICKITNKLPYNEYKQVHQVNLDILRLTKDPGVMHVLRTYFKSEPELLEASLFVSKPEQDQKNSGQNSFHFDYAGWESLNVLVYFTDITEKSSYHVIVKGSHKDRNIRDIFRKTLTQAEAEERYPSSIQDIKGPKGTIFFENTEAFHRRHRGNERRVMLNLLYASHRSLLSYGRASRHDIESRNKEFMKYNT